MMAAGDDDLYSLIESHDHQEIKLYVYNADTDGCREVSEWVWFVAHSTSRGVSGCGLSHTALVEG